MIGHIIGMIFIGLIIGALARLFLKGDQNLSILWTIVLGIVGSVAGGAATEFILGEGHSIIAFIVSVIVAMIAISVFIRVTRNK